VRGPGDRRMEQWSPLTCKSLEKNKTDLNSSAVWSKDMKWTLWLILTPTKDHSFRKK
jgi:hypothetical protein